MVTTGPSRIPIAQRRIEYVRLCDVPPAFRNPKKHDEPAIQASIHEHGFADAAILDERTQRLVAGHGRTKALVGMKAAGDRVPEGIEVDEDGEWLVPLQRGWSSKSDAHAEAFIIAHNRLTEAGGWDDRVLTSMLHDLATLDPDLFDGLGYSSDELDELFRTTDPERLDEEEDPFADSDTAAESTPAKDRIVTCPSCYHEFIPGKDD